MELWVILLIIYGIISIFATTIEFIIIYEGGGCLTIESLRVEGFNWFGTIVLFILQILFMTLIYIAALLVLAFMSEFPDWFA